jgi:hypothetical protein
LRSSAGTATGAAGVVVAAAAGVCTVAGVPGFGVFCCAAQHAAAIVTAQLTEKNRVNKKNHLLQTKSRQLFNYRSSDRTGTECSWLLATATCSLFPVACCLPLEQADPVRQIPYIRQPGKIQTVEIFRIVANRPQRKSPVLKIQPAAVPVVLRLQRAESL